MITEDTNRLSVYLVFAEPSGDFMQAAISLLGAGQAVVICAADENVLGLVMEDGSPFLIENVGAMLPMDGTVYIRPADRTQPIARIERRFLAP
jgi:hypothetical protein